MNEANFYKVYQLLSFFVLKFSYKTLNVPNGKKDEIWLINPNHEFYPLIRITLNSIEQVIFEKDRLDTIIETVFKRLHINKGRYLDIHISKEEILSDELYDSLSIEDHYYSGVALNDIYPGIQSAVHNVDDGNNEIREILYEINEYTKQAKVQKRNLKEKLPIVTSVTIVICIVMFILTTILSRKFGQINTLIVLGANYKMFTVGLNQFFRIVTSAFLHGGFLHLLMNMTALYSLGTGLEKEIGSLKFAIILFGSVIASSLFSLTFGENTVSVGMSGGLYGLFGVYLMIAYKNNRLHDPAIVRTILINLMINFVPNVDFLAHIGGLVSGIVFYYVLSNRKEFYAIYLAFVIILGIKAYTVDKIDPKYGGTDFEVTNVYRQMGFDHYADSLEMKLNHVYQER